MSHGDNKELLCFAHRSEAQAFLAKGDFKAVSELPGLYEWPEKNRLLFIVEEGIEEVLVRLTHVLSRFQGQIKKVINLGVVGALSERLRPFEVYLVRTSYGVFSGNPVFHSWSADCVVGKNLVDCVSVNERILSVEQAQKVKPFGDVVDRELWAIGKVCQFFKTPWVSMKVVSDEPLLSSEKNVCELVKSRAPLFSQRLLEKYEQWRNNVVAPPPESVSMDREVDEFMGAEFHWSTSMRFQLLGFAEKLMALGQWDLLKTKLRSLVLAAQIKNPKNRARYLLDLMRLELNPIKSRMQQQLFEQKQHLQSLGGDLYWADDFEGSELELRFLFNSPEQYRQKILALEQWDAQKAFGVLKGPSDAL